MGDVIVESSKVSTHTEDFVVEGWFKDSNKKKKRRSRRSKTNYSLSACSSVSEIFVDEPTLPGGISSSPQASPGNQFMLADNFVCSPISTMHRNEESANGDILNKPSISHNLEESIFSKSVPKGFASKETDGLVLIPRRVYPHDGPKYFPPHLSAEAVNKELEIYPKTMGGVIVESSTVSTHTEDFVVEGGFKDSNKKKKCRSRRSKTHYSHSACSSVSEIFVDEPTLPGGISSNQQASSGNQLLLADDNFVCSPISTMHLNEECANGDILNQPSISHDLEESIISKSIPEGFVSKETDGLVLIPHRVYPHDGPKYFPPHLSAEAVNKALEIYPKTMDGVIVESSRVSLTEDFVVDGGFKNSNKKKKCRSRRSKTYYSLSACSSVMEIFVDESTLPGGISSSQQASSGNQLLLAGDNFVCSPISTMHLNEESANGDILNQPLISHDSEESIIAKSIPEGFVSKETDGLVLIPRRVHSHVGPKYFPTHLSTEAANKALERGELLRALFRINAHNRLEAYCKVDGVQTDVLISGVVAQNRAFEGDTVAIVIDPPSLWPKMKGSNETLNVSACRASCMEQSEALMLCRGSSKEKNKLKLDFEHVCSGDYLGFSEDGTHYETGSSASMSDNRYVNGVLDNGYQPSIHDSTKPCYGDDYNLVNICEKLCYLVSLFPFRRPTGRVVAIIARSSRQDNIVGFLSVKQWLYSRDMKRKDSKKSKHQYNLNQGYILLTPTDPKFTKMTVPVVNLPTSIKKRLEVGDLTVENDIVAAKVVDWAEDRYIPEACVIQIFGRGSAVEALIAAILSENGIITSEFSPETLTYLPHLPLELPPKELQNRRDLRNLCIFTVDPATASDLDDALSVENLSNGDFRVGVHIADVSYFVLPDTSLDNDAQIRSTSVYLLQHKIPMLPPLLSDNLASLKPGADRLAFSIFWHISSMGEVLDHWIDRTIIRSCCKLSYEHAQEIIDGAFDAQDSSHCKNHCIELYGQFGWCDVTKSVKILNDLSNMLKLNRFKGGALSLESPEIVFLFDEEGMPYETVLSGRKDSNFLVEEFMLLANLTAAEVITRAYPSCALLRRHSEPNLRKLQDFESFCSKHGLELNISSTAHLHRSLDHIRLELKNDPVLLDILMSYAARPMQLAEYFCTGNLKYTDTDWGHYALAVPRYTHFTSPLRRYPDIVVHRMLAAIIEAESIYVEDKRTFEDPIRNEVLSRCFTGLCFNEDEIRSVKAQEALYNSATKFKLPCAETLTDVAAHCNERKLAARRIKDATNKLCMWLFLKKKEILFSEARVLGLGPRFMSIYISKLAIERRIYYDETEGLTVEWLESTSTLILSHSMHKRSNRKTSPGKCKVLEEVALLINPTGLKLDLDFLGHCGEKHEDSQKHEIIDHNIHHEPAVFPFTVNLLSKIPVALHAVGGDDGPIDIVARLYISSYFQ